MTKSEVMAALKAMGSEQTRKTLSRHGMPNGSYGVKIGDMKTLVKKIKINQPLALELYTTGISDAMYLAGLIADDSQFTKKTLQSWADAATWSMISEYTVPWVAAGSPHGWEMGCKWIDSKKPHVAAAGWNTLAGWVALTPDDELDLKAIEKLLQRVSRTIHDQPNRVRYTMNNFIINVGSYVLPLHAAALKAAKAVGKVDVDMGGTACKVPDAAAYIGKVEAHGSLGRKRKMIKC